MRRFVNNIISVMVSGVKFGVYKLILWNDFSAGLIERFSPNVVTEFNKDVM